jgi:hypothetical protein
MSLFVHRVCSCALKSPDLKLVLMRTYSFPKIAHTVSLALFFPYLGPLCPKSQPSGPFPRPDLQLAKPVIQFYTALYLAIHIIFARLFHSNLLAYIPRGLYASKGTLQCLFRLVWISQIKSKQSYWYRCLCLTGKYPRINVFLLLADPNW